MQDLLQQSLKLDAKDLKSREEEALLLKRQITDDTLAYSLMQHRAEEADARASELAEDLASWYHNPVVVGLLGLAGGALMTGVVYSAVHR